VVAETKPGVKLLIGNRFCPEEFSVVEYSSIILENILQARTPKWPA
jgi:hypothetical protein